MSQSVESECLVELSEFVGRVKILQHRQSLSACGHCWYNACVRSSVCASEIVSVCVCASWCVSESVRVLEQECELG